MKTSQSRQNHHRRKFKRRRNTLPGFPWEGRFQNKEEVEAYFADDKIQCLLCGKWFKQISTSHLLRIHEMTLSEPSSTYRLHPRLLNATRPTN